VRTIALLSAVVWSSACTTSVRAPAPDSVAKAPPATVAPVAGPLPSLNPPNPLPLAAPPLPVAPARVAPPWGYVMSVDHGIRADRAGKGFFRAPRGHGEHNGIDLLAPVGTPTVAPCAGQAHSGTAGGFGRWVHLVCPLPPAIAEGLFASLFYAHLDERAVGAKAQPVAAGDLLGTVGKTGNSASPAVAAHLHLELILHGSEKAALAETHGGRDQADNEATQRFVEAITPACLEPTGLHPLHADLRRKRRVDPFVALTCIGIDKPPLTAPAAPLDQAFVPWHDAYAASYAVDEGRP
jgi:murein DD-endopeptidase MepM/ murein hydrolase activator NlpD